MSEQQMTMTKDEFANHLDKAFDSGSLAALDSLLDVIAALRSRLAKPAAEPAPAGDEGGA